MFKGRMCLSVSVMAASLFVGPVARASVIENTVRGLGIFGFNVQGQQNFLSGGVDLLINRNLVGNPLDFGDFSLTLTGPVSFDASTGGRFLQQVDLSFSTAINADSAATPLGYEIDFGVGGQSTQIAGTVFLDAGLSVNRLGFYDVVFDYQVSQTVTSSGSLANDTSMGESQLGPVNLSGNIFADALALVTLPLFAQSGEVNPFATFSGDNSLASLLTDPAGNAMARLIAGANTRAEESVNASNGSSTSRVSNEFGRDVGLQADPFGGRLEPTGAVVPEPTVVLLMLLGVPLLVVRRRRRGTA